MFVHCHGCGGKQQLDTRRYCELCGVVLRRCADCSNYLVEFSRCMPKKTIIEKWEANKPGPLALSVNCLDFRPKMAIAA
jgi:hypothetical protein